MIQSSVSVTSTLILLFVFLITMAIFFYLKNKFESLLSDDKIWCLILFITFICEYLISKLLMLFFAF